jgi:hypothetical protein
MSSRPRTGPQGRLRQQTARLAPGGRLWSESAVRRPQPRVVVAGEPGPACGTTFPRVALTATYADFAGAFGAIGMNFQVTWSTSYVGPFSIRVASITADLTDPPAYDNSPTAWEPCTGPGGATQILPADLDNVAGGGSITGWRIEWDTPGAVTAICSIPIGNG